MITGLTPSTFQKLQLNAGVLLKNFDYASIADKTALAAAIKTAIAGDSWIGATRGGGSFEAAPDIREIEADGKRSPFKGSTINDGWTCKLSATLLEMTADNLVMALGAAEKTVSGSKTTVELHTEIKTEDYIDHVCWIGDLSDGSFVLIEIDNALNVGTFNLAFDDKNEGTIPLELTATQASVDGQDKAPCRIVYFN